MTFYPLFLHNIQVLHLEPRQITPYFAGMNTASEIQELEQNTSARRSHVCKQDCNGVQRFFKKESIDPIDNILGISI